MNNTRFAYQYYCKEQRANPYHWQEWALRTGLFDGYNHTPISPAILAAVEQSKYVADPTAREIRFRKGLNRVCAGSHCGYYTVTVWRVDRKILDLRVFVGTGDAAPGFFGWVAGMLDFYGVKS